MTEQKPYLCDYKISKLKGRNSFQCRVTLVKASSQGRLECKPENITQCSRLYSETTMNKPLPGSHSESKDEPGDVGSATHPKDS